MPRAHLNVDDLRNFQHLYSSRPCTDRSAKEGGGRKGGVMVRVFRIIGNTVTAPGMESGEEWRILDISNVVDY